MDDLLIEREQPKRALVPTPRLADGAAPDILQPIDVEHERRPVRAVIRDWAHGVDPRSIPGSKVPLVVLGLLGALVAWDFNSIAVLVFEMRADFGFDLVFLATLASLISGIGYLIAPLMGYLADRVSRVWMLRIGALCATAAVAGTAGARSIGVLIIARALGGIALVVGGGAATFPLLTDWYPSTSRARVFAVIGVAAPLGAVFGPLLAGWLASSAGWRTALYPEIGLALLAAAGTFLLREPARGYMDRLEMGATEEVARREQKPAGWSESWRAAASIVTLRRLWFATPFLRIGGSGALFLLAAYFVDVLHLTPGQRGVITAAGGVASLVALIFAGPIADAMLQRRPERVMSLGGTIPIISAAMFVLLAFFPYIALSVPLSLVVAAASGILSIAGFALMSLVTPARVRGLGLQIGTWFELPGLIVMPLLVGYAQANWGLQRGMLVFVPLLVIGGVIVMSASGGVARDMRAARAAAMADEEAERSRRERLDKMVIIRDLDVTYDGTQVLFGVDLDIGSGEIVALLGTNGAGKSTLLRAIVGIQQASNGAIIVDGQDITHAPPHENARRGIMMVPGGHGVFPTLTVSENLATAARAVGADDARARIADVLAMFPALRARTGELAGNLSGGEQQMLAMGQAFLSKPRVLMIDELSLGLAPALVEQLIATVRRIHAEGTTVVLVEQSINVALTIAERAVFMEKGEVRFDGPATDLMRRPDLIRSVFMGGAAGGAPQRGIRRKTERETIVRADNISVRFGGVEAVRDASLDAAAGEVVGIIGPNGAGKSTLFDVIAGGTPPNTGRVTLHGNDVTLMAPHERARAGLGRSFQTARLFGSLTVRECIAVAMERHVRVTNPLFSAAWAPRARADERRIQRRVESLVHLLGLKAYADKFVSELSTGTRRAVDIACIMAAEPTVVLLDEPSSGLAQAESEALAPLLTRLVRDTGCALIVIEHDLPMIASIADRLVAMDVGEVIATGTPSEVLSNDRVVRSYLAATDEVIQRSDLHNLTSTR